MYFYALVALTIFVFSLLVARIWQENRTIQPVVEDWPDPTDDLDCRPPPSGEEFCRQMEEAGWVLGGRGFWTNAEWRERLSPKGRLRHARQVALRADGWREARPGLWVPPDDDTY